MEYKNHCSICGKTDHNKRTCPCKPISDISRNELYIQEEISISTKKENFINDLLDKEAYSISDKIFMLWLKNKKPIKQSEVKYVCNKGLNIDSIKLYLEVIKDIDSYY